MSNFDLTFCKVYIYAKGWPGINLGASNESCTHLKMQCMECVCAYPLIDVLGNTHKTTSFQNLHLFKLWNLFDIDDSI